MLRGLGALRLFGGFVLGLGGVGGCFGFGRTRLTGAFFFDSLVGGLAGSEMDAVMDMRVPVVYEEVCGG